MLCVACVVCGAAQKAQKKMLDVINSVGLSSSVLKMIERRHKNDLYLALGGMVGGGLCAAVGWPSSVQLVQLNQLRYCCCTAGLLRPAGGRADVVSVGTAVMNDHACSAMWVLTGSVVCPYAQGLLVLRSWSDVWRGC